MSSENMEVVPASASNTPEGAQGASEQTFTKFLDLPADIRDMIYSFCISELPTYKPKKRLGSKPGPRPVTISPKFGLLLANKQLSEEFLERVYRREVIVFDINFRDTDGFEQWFVSEKVLERIVRCRFRRDMNQSPEMAKRDTEVNLHTIVHRLPNLRRMEFEIIPTPAMAVAAGDSPASSFLESFLKEELPDPLSHYAAGVPYHF